MKKKLYFNLINIFIIIGILIAAFLIYEHFSPSASKFCNFGKSLDCGIVNKSPYANLDGLFYLLTIDFGISLPASLMTISDSGVFLDLITSNAFLGALTLLFLLLLTRANYKNSKFLFIKKGATKRWMKGITLFGVLYGFYLFLIQHFILKTYCIFCLALDATLLTLLILTWFVKVKK